MIYFLKDWQIWNGETSEKIYIVRAEDAHWMYEKFAEYPRIRAKFLPRGVDKAWADGIEVTSINEQGTNKTVIWGDSSILKHTIFKRLLNGEYRKWEFA